MSNVHTNIYSYRLNQHNPKRVKKRLEKTLAKIEIQSQNDAMEIIHVFQGKFFIKPSDIKQVFTGSVLYDPTEIRKIFGFSHLVHGYSSHTCKCLGKLDSKVGFTKILR